MLKRDWDCPPYSVQCHHPFLFEALRLVFEEVLPRLLLLMLLLGPSALLL